MRRRKRWTPAPLIQAVERVTRKTRQTQLEGLLLAVMRMDRQRKPLPKSKREAYEERWDYVLLQAVGQKVGWRRE